MKKYNSKDCVPFLSTKHDDGRIYPLAQIMDRSGNRRSLYEVYEATDIDPLLAELRAKLAAAEKRIEELDKYIANIGGAGPRKGE